jgi:hypothetical protein
MAMGKRPTGEELDAQTERLMRSGRVARDEPHQGSDEIPPKMSWWARS